MASPRSTTALPAVVALRLDRTQVPTAAGSVTDVAGLARGLVSAWLAGATLPEPGFPLPGVGDDEVRTVPGLDVDVVVRWLDALTDDDGAQAPRLGCNADFLAWFGDGWDDGSGGTPEGRGSDTAGWLWVNHESLSGSLPGAVGPATSQALTLARWMKAQGRLGGDPEAAVWSPTDAQALRSRVKRELGGSWLRVTLGSSGRYALARHPAARRYDATDATLLSVTGTPPLQAPHDDSGGPLPSDVLVGTARNCAGSVTPWGTILCGEEGDGGYYGALESCWTSDNGFVPGQGFDPGADVAPTASAASSSTFGALLDPDERHGRDTLGWVAELDPGVDARTWLGSAAPGVGHRKLGALGRATWESGVLALDAAGRLVVGQPLVLYAGDDRKGGRLFKLVSRAPVAAGMSRAALRALLDDALLYVAHCEALHNGDGRTLLATGLKPTEAAPGTGRWVLLSRASTEIAPNAAALGASGTTVGQALDSATWNGIGRFADDAMLRRCLFSACAKLGIRELNRPEDLAWSPSDPRGPRLYLALSNFDGGTCLDAAGRLAAGTRRADPTGAIWALVESDPTRPAAASTFTFHEVWGGRAAGDALAAACPDNLLLDAQGGLWFTTDGDQAVSGRSEALYYLDLDPAHAATSAYGQAFRMATMPADAEPTGPCFTSAQGALLLSVQHPGVTRVSSWPHGR